MRNNLKFCYFWKKLVRIVLVVGRGVIVLRLTLGTPGGVGIARGDWGAGLQLGRDAAEDV